MQGSCFDILHRTSLLTSFFFLLPSYLLIVCSCRYLRRLNDNESICTLLHSVPTRFGVFCIYAISFLSPCLRRSVTYGYDGQCSNYKKEHKQVVCTQMSASSQSSTKNDTSTKDQRKRTTASDDRGYGSASVHLNICSSVCSEHHQRCFPASTLYLSLFFLIGIESY